MKFRYHKETDSLYIHLADKPSVESEEVAPNLVLDFDENGAVVGIDIDHASKHVDLQSLEIDMEPTTKLISRIFAQAA
jgi:uncharacterized protein YuzE